MVVLPECFNSPYGTQYFRQYSETIPGESTNRLSEIAKETNTYVVGGKSTGTLICQIDKNVPSI